MHLLLVAVMLLMNDAPDDGLKGVAQAIAAQSPGEWQREELVERVRARHPIDVT